MDAEALRRAFEHLGVPPDTARVDATSLANAYPRARLDAGRSRADGQVGVRLLRHACSSAPVRDVDGRPVLLQTCAVLPGDAEAQLCQAVSAMAEAYRAFDTLPEVLLLFDMRGKDFGFAHKVVRELLRFPHVVHVHVVGANGAVVWGWSLVRHIVPFANAVRIEGDIGPGVRARFVVDQLSCDWGGSATWEPAERCAAEALTRGDDRVAAAQSYATAGTTAAVAMVTVALVAAWSAVVSSECRAAFAVVGILHTFGTLWSVTSLRRT